MSFAKPPATRGHGRPSSKPAGVKSRTPSVSSTSSRQSQDGASRPASAHSNRSAPGSAAGDSANTQPQPGSSGSSNPVEQQPPNPSAPQPTSDPLQVAAQVYPWLYMTSTLDACFKTAETNAERDITDRTRELDEQESEVADQRVRLEAERSIEFYDELASDKFATTAPSTMQAFLAHGDACTLIESEALKLAMMSEPTVSEDDFYSPMRPYNAMLDKIEALQRECSQLHASVVALTQNAGPEPEAESEEAEAEDGPGAGSDFPTARSQIISVFSACLPILQARAANLQMAHELLEGAKENLAMSLQLESLEGEDEDEEPEDD